MEEGPPAQNSRPDGEGVPGQPGPSPPPSASAPAPDPPEQIHEQEEEEEEVPHLSAENKQLKSQNQEKEEPVSHLPQEVQELERKVSPLQQAVQELKEQLSRLCAKNQQLKQQNQEKDKPVSGLLQELKEQVSRLQQEVQALKGEVSPLQQEVQEQKKSPEAFGAQQTTRWLSWVRSQILPAKDFFVQVRISGRTDGCEGKFLLDVSRRLSLQRVSLQVKEFAETSKDPLLLFCPIASRMRNDIENALEGLSDEQKVLLVVMHYVRKENPGSSVNAKQPVTPPAVVRTVHTRFTLNDGFYPCQMNETAVADVAAALKALAEDQ